MRCNATYLTVLTLASGFPTQRRIAILATTVAVSVAANAWMALSRYNVCRSIRRCLDAVVVVVRERSPFLSPAQKLKGSQPGSKADRANSQAGTRMYRSDSEMDQPPNRTNHGSGQMPGK